MFNSVVCSYLDLLYYFTAASNCHAHRGATIFLHYNCYFSLRLAPFLRGDLPGGRAVADLGGTPLGPDFSGGTFNKTIELHGNASVSIFPQPGANSRSAFAGYTFQIVIGPQVSGDTFTFRLKQVNTCHNSSGPCIAADLTVAGATTIKGKLENGQKITATQPVVITVTQAISASNVIPTWSENTTTTLDITPLKEVQTPAELDGLDDITSIGGDRFHDGVV